MMRASEVGKRMLSLDRLRRVKLRAVPPGQVFMASVVLRADYSFPRRTEIVLEGVDQHLDRERRYIFAMNHTDRYNYWPFQWQLWREGRGFTATWVKGKYYENRLLGAFMDSMNNIPLPSRGYVFSSQFRQRIGAPPTEAEYRLLRDIVDGKFNAAERLPAAATDAVRAFIGSDTPAAFLADFEAEFDAMIREVVRLSQRAAAIGNHLLIFPEGTRSVRLARGRIGLAQIFQHIRLPVVPVGCNGSHRLYPGDSPLSKGGRVVYRIGAPIEADDPALSKLQVPADVLPFTRQAESYRDRYEAITAVIMERIAALLDPEHLPEVGDAPQVQGVQRFL